MTHPIRFALVLAPAILAAQAPAPVPPRFVSFPDIHGERVVFTYDGDLWAGDVKGGPATRLTSHPGTEFAARFSPDGRWIAFSAGYDGGQNVYVMPAQGGTPRRLTWRGACQVRGWSPDGRKVLFSMAARSESRPVSQVWAVDLEGSEPEALPLGIAAQAAYSPDGGRILYNPKGQEEYYWKRYKGGQHPEIWLADLKAGTHRRVTPYVGKNAHPMWTAEGGALFVSDRGDRGVSNLYRLDLATGGAAALTSFTDYDVQWPSTDGRRVVFSQAGQLHVLDLATGAERRLDITAPSDLVRTLPRTVNAKDTLQHVSLAPGGKRFVVEARGDLFVLPVEADAPARNLTRTSGVRERFPAVSPDGKQVAYFSDESGEYDLYVRPAEGGPARRIPTGLATTVYHLAWSPDGTKLLFGDKTFALHLVDVASGKGEVIATSRNLKNDEFTWETADYAWSPDSAWIAYTLVEDNRNARVWLHNVKTGKKSPVTDGFFDALNPRFDQDGTTLYFLSYNNFQIRLDPGEANAIEQAPTSVMAVQLRKDETSDGPFRIDLEGLAGRVTRLAAKPGNLFHLQAGKGVVGWSSVEGWDDSVVEEVYRPRGQAKWTVHFLEKGAKAEVTLPEPVSEWGLDPGGTAFWARRPDALHAGGLQQVLASRTLPARVDLDRLTVTVDPKQEWNQIFSDTWRWYRDFFYDVNMHGKDWKAVGEGFRSWLPQATSRADVNWLLSQLVGELCVSHTYVGGGDQGPQQAPAPVKTAGLLGADLKAGPEGYYRFEKVYGPTPYAPELKGPLTGKAKEGDYLVAIDGEPLKAPEAVYRRLQATRGQKVRISVNTRPSLEGARVLEVETVPQDMDLRYAAWVAGNIETVERLSGGQLGYMHITAMAGPNIGQFDKYWRAFRYRKGIVVDVRGNGGGWTEYFLVSRLENRQVGFNVLQGMNPFRYPNTASDGRYVFLSNELNGSDGEAFLAHVKARNLGTLVGVPSWGGLVGIVNAQPTLDGGSVNQPNNAFYGREGTWWIENHGAEPDIRVENDPATWMAGHDRQLETGVETLLKQLKENPTPAFPARPPYPVR